MKKVSIIIPVYNAEKYLKRCIESVINQTYKNIEIILVDDGSNDGSNDICKYYKQNDDRIILLTQKNQGVSYARNNALGKCSGNFITFVDSDDWLNEDAISNYVEIQHKYNADLVICNFNHACANSKTINDNNDKDLILNTNETFKMLFSDEYFQGFVWNKLFKREILIESKIKFDENIQMGEDLLFVSSYLINCKNVIYNKKAIYNYFENTESAIRKKFDKKYLTLIDTLKSVQDVIKPLNDNIKDNYNIFKTKKIIGIIDKMACSRVKDSSILKKIKLEIKESYDEIKNKSCIENFLKIKVMICRCSISLYWYLLYTRSYISKQKS